MTEIAASDIKFNIKSFQKKNSKKTKNERLMSDGLEPNTAARGLSSVLLSAYNQDYTEVTCPTLILRQKSPQ